MTYLWLVFSFCHDAYPGRFTRHTHASLSLFFFCKPDIIDEEYPDICASIQASVSSVYFYEAEQLPERYRNSLFVGDYSKVGIVTRILPTVAYR